MGKLYKNNINSRRHTARSTLISLVVFTIVLSFALIVNFVKSDNYADNLVNPDSSTNSIQSSEPTNNEVSIDDPSNSNAQISENRIPILDRINPETGVKLSPKDDIDYEIKLVGDSASQVARNTSGIPEGSLAPISDDARQQADKRRAEIESGVNNIFSKIQEADPDAKLLHVLTNVYPALSVKATPEAISSIENDSKVDSIAVTGKSHIDEDESPQPIAPMNGPSAVLTGANAVWADGNTGAGVNIAVIDTGFDYTHRDFGSKSLGEAYSGTMHMLEEFRGMGYGTMPPNDPAVACMTSDAILSAEYKCARLLKDYDDVMTPEQAQRIFNNVTDRSKFIDGWDFGDNDPNPLPKISPTAFGLDHGSHVAGTIAGYGVLNEGYVFHGDYTTLSDEKIDPTQASNLFKVAPGMAPKAGIYAYKVQADDAQGMATSAIVAAIDKCIEVNQQPGVFESHKQINLINMSLGADYGDAQDPEDLAVDEAFRQGILSLIAAGNSSDETDIGGAPGNSETSITVAASNGGKYNHQSIQTIASTDGAITNWAASYSVYYESQHGTEFTGEVYDMTDGDNQYGCNPFSEPDHTNAQGKFVLLNYNTGSNPCLSSVSAGNAASVANGEEKPLGVILVSSESDVYGISLGGISDLADIIVSGDAGDAIKEGISSNNTVKIDYDSAQNLEKLDSYVDTAASFTSRGDHGSYSAIVKPDLSAPGVSITSVSAGTASKETDASGTSMATPHTAGLTALSIAAHPDWTMQQIKASMINNAYHDVTTKRDGNEIEYGPLRSGSGRVDAMASTKADTVVFDHDRPNLVTGSWGVVNLNVSSGTYSSTKTFDVKNTSSSEKVYSISYLPRTEVEGVEYEVSADSITVSANSIGQFTVTLEVSDTSSLRRNIDPTMVANDSAEGIVRNFVSSATGVIEVTPADATPLRVSLVATVRPTSDMSGTFDTSTNQIDLSGDSFANVAGDLGDTQSLVAPFVLGQTLDEKPYDPEHSVNARSRMIRAVGASSTMKTQGDSGYLNIGVAMDGNQNVFNDWKPVVVVVQVKETGKYYFMVTQTGHISLKQFPKDDPTSNLDLAFYGAEAYGNEGGISDNSDIYNSLLFNEAGKYIGKTPINNASGNLDTNVFDTNTFILSARLDQLGITSSMQNSTVTYRVLSDYATNHSTGIYSGGDATSETQNIDFDVKNPAFSFFGTATNSSVVDTSLDTSMQNPNLLFKDSAGSIKVGRGSDSADAGILLLHLHNADDSRYQIVVGPSGVVNSAPSVAALASYSVSGIGSEANPYIITTAQQLSDVMKLTNSGKLNELVGRDDYYFKLGNDIDLTSVTSLTSNMEGTSLWTGIGNADHPFTGHFDGDGHTIKNLNIIGNDSGIYSDIENITSYGLFGVTSGAVIQNFGVISGFVQAAGAAGTIVGKATNGTVIRNVFSKASVSIKYPYIYTASDDNEDVTFQEQTGYAGGVVGSLESSTIENAYNSGQVQGQAWPISLQVTTDYAGSIVGAAKNSAISNVVNTADIISNGPIADGGLNYISSIIGRSEDTKLTNAVSLARQVSNADSFHKVIGQSIGTGNAYTNNYAYANVYSSASCYGSDGGTDEAIENGESNDYDQFSNANWWHSTAGFDTSLWSFEDNKYPKLSSIKYDQTAPILQSAYPASSVIPFASGDGTQESPYQISTARSMDCWSMLTRQHPEVGSKYANVNGSNTYFELASDIDLAGSDRLGTGFGFVPIHDFLGHFDGKGHVIKNLHIDSTVPMLITNMHDPSYIYTNDTGLFDQLWGSDIKNVGISSGSIKGKLNVGALAGSMVELEGLDGVKSTVKINNVLNCAEVTSTLGSAGGIVASGNSGATITDVYNTGTITGFDAAGGIFAVINSSTDLIHAYNSGDIVTSSYAAGLVGKISGIENTHVNIKDSASLGSSIRGTGVTDSVQTARITNIHTSSYGGPDVVLSNNYAVNLIAKMIVLGNDVNCGVDDTAANTDWDGTPENGIDIELTDVANAQWWETSSLWNEAWSSDLWVFQNQKLPVLRSINFSQQGAIPLYKSKSVVDPGNAQIFEGDGTENNPYQIDNGRDLYCLSRVINWHTDPYNLPGKYYELQNDVDISSINVNSANYNTAEISGKPGWMSIGSYDPTGDAGNDIGFQGVFDGQNHKISGIHSTDALFQFIDGATLKNFSVSGEISGYPAYSTASIAAYSNRSTISNVNSSVNISTLPISYPTLMGGLVGQLRDSTITDSYYTGTISNNDGISGGIAAYAFNSLIDRTYTTGDTYVRSNHSEAISGAIVGEQLKGSLVQNSYSIGSVIPRTTYTITSGISALTITGASEFLRKINAVENSASLGISVGLNCETLVDYYAKRNCNQSDEAKDTSRIVGVSYWIFIGHGYQSGNYGWEGQDVAGEEKDDTASDNLNGASISAEEIRDRGTWSNAEGDGIFDTKVANNNNTPVKALDAPVNVTAAAMNNGSWFLGNECTKVLPLLTGFGESAHGYNASTGEQTGEIPFHLLDLQNPDRDNIPSSCNASTEEVNKLNTSTLAGTGVNIQLSLTILLFLATAVGCMSRYRRRKLSKEFAI